MRRSGRPGLVLPALALAILAAALLPAAASAAPAVTLEAENADVELGKGTVLSGRVTGAPRQDLEVTLIAKKFPYKRAVLADTVTAAANGRFSFRVRPTLNTIYRAEVELQSGVVASPASRVYISLSKQDTNFRTVGDVAVSRFYVQFPPDYPLPIAGRKITWYFRKTTDKLFRAVKTTRSKESSGRLVGQTNVPLPRGNYRYTITWCFALGRQGQDIGFGRNAGGGCSSSFRARPLAARVG